MNKHRLQRKSKKIQGKGFFLDAVGPAFTVLRDALESKSKAFVQDKLNEILSMKIKRGAGLKFL